MTTTPTRKTYKLPPATANIPSPPPDFVPTGPDDYRGVMPRKAELAVIADAVAQLKACVDFTDAFGRSMPSIDIVIAMFEGGAEWSKTRAMASAYDAYCRTQEGLIWIDLRKLMAEIRPVFERTVARDPELAARLSALGHLLGAKQAIARSGVATRNANREAIAKGEPPTHGGRAKAKIKAAEKAALAARRLADATPK